MFYHVSITPRTLGVNGRRLENELDLNADALNDRFLEPYRAGRPIIINGRTVTMTDLERIKVYESQGKMSGLGRTPWASMEDVTSQYITGEPGNLEDTAHPRHERRPEANAREVFVVHGRNNRARDALFQFLSAIGLFPLEWAEAVSSTGRTSPYIGDILDAAFSRAHAIVVLFTPDDEARLKEEFQNESDPPHETELTGQARQNVLFEAGMALGQSEDRTILVELGRLRPFSDIAGRHVIRLDDSTQRRQELAQRLSIAGCPVRLEGTYWHSAGEFELAISEISEALSELETTVETGRADNYSLAISEEAKELLLEVAKDAEKKNGAVTKAKTLGGTFIQTNGRNFTDARDRRSVAKWESAIQELASLGFLVDATGNDSVFQITNQGFEAVDNF